MRVYEGETVTLGATTGARVLLSDGSSPVHQVESVGGQAVFEKLPLGKYWAAVRHDDGTVATLGTVEVVPLHDPVEVRLRKELGDLDAKIADLELTFQRTNTNSGETEMQVQLGALRRQRSNAETRLFDYLGRPTKWG